MNSCWPVKITPASVSTVKWTSASEEQVKTGSIVPSYRETLPEFVYIRFLRYKPTARVRVGVSDV